MRSISPTGTAGSGCSTIPISEDMKAMRPSLLPGLLAAAKRNLDRGAPGVRLFEIGRRYLRGEGGSSDERLTLALCWRATRRRAAGRAARQAASMRSTPRRGRGVAGRSGRSGRQAAGDGRGGSAIPSRPVRHPAARAEDRAGPLRRAASRTLEAFDIDGPVVAVEMFLDAIPAKKGGGFARAPTPRPRCRR